MKHRKYAYFILIFLLVFLLVFLSGCSDKSKNEAAIIEDLQAHVAFISPTAKINDCEIIKRQTDKDARSDVVYVTVNAESEQLTCTLSFVLRYELYNEGWLLESVNRTDGPWEISGLNEDQLVSDIENHDYYFSDWSLDVQDVEIVDEGYNSSASNLYEKWLTVSLTAQHSLFDYYATYNVFYEIVDGDWKVQNVETQNRRYVPTYSLNTSASDKIMETLEMDLFLGEGIMYDSFEYLRTDEDWENCQETRYYTATKNWFYGTETFIVAIPLNFYLEDGDTHWSYNSNEITHNLQSVDWNIAGEWSCNYAELDGWGAPLNGYAVARLRINDVIATDDPTVYQVNLYCNGYSTYYSFLCHADDGELAELSYYDGHWTLKIDAPDDLESGSIWYGSFTFYGYEYLSRQGVYWNCTTDGVKLNRA